MRTRIRSGNGPEEQTISSPYISVIVAVFNGAATLPRCLDSFFRQTYPNKELLIIDGGSKDGTVALLEANEEHLGYWISEPDGGIYDAWNKGVCQAKGEWICFLGADDFFWEEHVLEKMATKLAMLPEGINAAYGQVMLLNQNGGALHPIGRAWAEVKSSFRQIMSVPHPGLMHRRGLFERYGGFDDSFRIAGDYEFLLRELLKNEAAFIAGIITVGMTQGGISSSPTNSLVAMREMRRAQKMHGLSRPGMCWLQATARIYLRLIAWELLGEKAARRLLDMARELRGHPPYWTRV